ncbi:HlyD family efflux transporter periplasmic adaptor subunit [Macrococcus armenti]|uniref:HlyD family efflux transporter periplasmic adaptor subunit n=1 Tax=Macrococcus armenti TaxID=2875764 RepID=UPI001CCA159D|nr:efflux RND transporter periplasmic adaptor subunit [Macrococcus armenti]UBH15750.1 efflux RND transporter periplasmic adaptor subunit [Macrococcus armenti]UBH18109.1 efflux RND transporter periplasmic adaptor subunit [Macrococcus armenti]UBH20376.1 efflux RND transporter periplasmic adaptor subunit [Macrococcus armenti]
MKKDWVLPLILGSIILIILSLSLFAYISKTNDEKNKLYLGDYIKENQLHVKGKLSRDTIPFYQKGNKSQPVTLHVAEGDEIEVGKPLFSYESSDSVQAQKVLELEIDNKLIEKDQKEGQLLEREQRLQNNNNNETLNAEINWLENEIRKIDNDLDILNIKSDELTNKIDRQTIKAPKKGKVLQINQQQLAKHTLVNQNEPIMIIGNEKIKIKGQVNRDTALQMKKDQVMKFKLDDKETEGKIISVKQKIDGERIYFEYEASVDVDDPYYVGQKIKGSIKHNTINNIWIPKSYVKEKKNKKKTEYYVQKVYGKDVNEEKVVVNGATKDALLITKGLTTIDELKKYE